jgi:nitrogen fixation NifU-like protein
MRLRVEEDCVAAAAFEAEGCAISRAAASALAEVLPAWQVDEVPARRLQYEQRLGLGSSDDPSAEASSGDGLGDLAAFAGVREFPTRVRCAALPFRALEEALAG